MNETRYCTVSGILYALPASETTLHCALWVQGHSAAQCARGHRAQPPRSPQSPLPRAIVAGIAEPAFDPPVPEAYGSLCPTRSPRGAGICIALSAFPSLHGCSLARRLRKESLDREVKLAAVLVSSDMYRNAQGDVT